MSLTIGVLNCTTGGANTGTLGCAVNPNNINNLMLAKKGWSLDVTSDTLDQETIDELIQKGVLIPLPSHFSREDANEETQYETSEIGVKIKVRPGNVEFVVNYAIGVCFSKALESLSSRNLDLLFVDYEDRKSRLWGALVGDKFKGFDLSLNNAENFILPTGTTGAKKPLRIQLSPKGTSEYNKNMDFAVSDEIDFGSLDGINDVVINTVSNGTDLVVTLTSACDKTTSFEGFEATDFRITDNTGVVQSGFTVNYSDGQYTISGLDAGTYNVQLYDSALGSSVVAVDGMYYRSDVLNVVISA